MTMAGAVSKRRRFRYAKELRRYKQTAKWKTVAAPKAPIISSASAGGAGAVSLLIDQYSAWGWDGLAPTVQWSPDGVGTWTTIGLQSFVTGSRVLKTAAVAVGLKYFRIAASNTVGAGAFSNVKPVTVT